MKRLVSVVVVSVFAASGCCSQESQSRAFNDALRNGAKAKHTFKIKDAIEKPISNATVNVGFVMMNNRSQKVVGSTDTNGLFTAEGLTQWEVGVRVSKDGYYDSTWGVFLGRDGQEVSDGCWQPWNPTIPIVLREKRNPIPMYATWVDEWQLPNDTDVGFDCAKGDLLEPHGKGKVADFNIRVTSNGTPFKDATSRLRLSAADEGGGFIRKQKIHWSEFVSEHEAPEYGYHPELQTSNEVKRPFYEANPDDLSAGEYLIFKSRIVRDEKGNIISANYSKIYGRLGYGVGNNPHEKSARFQKDTNYGGVKFPYYFNPTPNDRNLEFNGEKNLFNPKERKSIYSLPEF
jgi:hypothetical protein